MARLLRANFTRLWKTTEFWGCIIIPMSLCLIMEILQGGSGFFVSMYNAAPVSLFFTAIFAVMYIGTDNSDRTVRNKLIIGISRIKVYFANLITVSVGMTLIFAAVWAALIAFDLTQGRQLDIEAWNLALYVLLCLAAGTAMVAVCTLLAMLVTSRPLASAVTISLTIGMFVITQSCINLSNSSSFAKIAYNILPTSQMWNVQINVGFMNSTPEVFKLGGTIEPMWYSLGVFSVSTVVGALVFRRKDIK